MLLLQTHSFFVLRFRFPELKNLIDQVEQPEGTLVDDRKFLRLSGRQ